jgi:hypothetical protein
MWWEDDMNLLVGASLHYHRHLERSGVGVTQLTYLNNCLETFPRFDELALWMTRSSVRHFTLRGIDLSRLSALFYIRVSQC